MSYYDNDASWSAPVRQPSWEQPPPPSRSGTGSSMSQQPDPHAFASQFEEIDRAADNLMRSGKWFPGPMPAAGGMPIRRDSVPQRGGYEYGGADPRMGGGGNAGGPSSRHQSMSEYDGGRPGSAGLQGYYQGQRFPGGRQSEAEQMLQTKRRMAAQRERELRNYHQEQQYNRSGKSDRSMSPNTMSEDDRRELIARQHRALYGDNSSMYGSEGSSSRPQSQDVRAGTTGRGASPLAFDPYGVQGSQNAEGSVQMPPRDRGNSTASPVSNQQQAQQQPYSLLGDAQQQSSRASNSPPTESPPPGSQSKASAPGVAPIGTRPSQAAPSSAGGLNKRSTTPLTPSSLSYGFSAEQQQQQGGQSAASKDERSTSAASNPAAPAPTDKGGVSGLGGWGSNSGVWGSSAGKGLAVQQPSVWG